MDQLQVYHDNSNTSRFVAVNLQTVACRVLTRHVCCVIPVLVIRILPCLATKPRHWPGRVWWMTPLPYITSIKEFCYGP